MRSLKPSLILLVLLLAASANLDVSSTPTVNVDSPQDGDVFTTKTVTFSGKSAGSDGSWFQGSKAAFNGGTKDSVVVTESGTVQLTQRVADDFDDNSLNTTTWTEQTNKGISVSEEDQCLNISGTVAGSTGSYTGFAHVQSEPHVSAYISADLKSFSGSGNGYRTHIFLIQDVNNYVQIGQIYDSSSYGKRVLEWGYTTGGSGYSASLGNAPSGEHTYKITYSGGTAKVYQDGVEKASKAMTLTSVSMRIVAAGKGNNDKVVAIWDNASSGRATPGTLTSSIYDTRCSPPVLRYADWNDTTTTTTSLALEVRSSDSSDMGSPTAWSSVSKAQSNGLPTVKRYLQWRATLTTTNDSDTPELLNVTFQYHKPISKVELSLDSMATWTLATGKNTWSKTLDLPEDTTRVWIRVTDAAGDTNITSVTVTVDTTPPTGSIVVNEGASFTGAQEAILTLYANDRYGVAEMMLSDRPDFAGATWTNFTTTMDWTLPAGDGLKTVHARFKDRNGLISPPINDSIVLDTEAPVGSVLIDDDAVYTNTTGVTLRLSATDLTGTTEMGLSESPAFDGAIWMTYSTSAPFTLLPADGVRTVYVRFRDALGHVSQTASDTIVLDTIPPLANLVLNNRSAFTNSRSLELRVTTQDASPITFMQVGEGAAPTWGLIEAFAATRAFVISPGDGPRNVAVRVWDAAGNMGSIGWATIILDTVPPVVQVVLAGGKDYTNNRVVSVELNVTDAGLPYQMQLGEDPELVGVELVAYMSLTSIVLSQEEGPKTVYARVLDAAGNLGPVDFDTITLDLTAPAIGMTINGGATLTNERGVTVQLTIVERFGTDYVELDEDQSFTSTAHVPFEASMVWTLSQPEGSKALYVRAMDFAGNLGEAVSATITLDTTPPVVTVTIDDGATFTNRTGVSVEVRVVDIHPGGQVELAEDLSFSPAVQREPGAPFIHMLSMGDGIKILYARATDLAGNVGAVATTSIILDTTASSLGIVIDGGSPLTAERVVTVALNATDPSGVIEMVVWEGTSPIGAATVPFAPSTTMTLSEGDGVRTLGATIRDGAGNWCSAVTASITLDTTPPKTTILAMHNRSEALEFLVTWTGVDITSGVRAYDVQYRIGDGPWVDWQSGTNATQGAFIGKAGNVYYLRARAVDAAGNTEMYSEDPLDIVRVTIEEPVRFFERPVTMAVILAIIIAVIVTVAYSIYRRRRAQDG